MADQSSSDLTIPKSDAGLAFRMEMWASNTLLGYWWVLALAIAALLAGVAIYAIYDNYNTSSQRGTSLQAATALDAAADSLLDKDKIKQMEWVETESGPWRQAQFVPSLGYSDMDPSMYPPKIYIPLASAIESHGKDDGNREAALIDSADALMAAYSNGSGLAAYQAALYAAEMYKMAANDEGRIKALEAASNAGNDNVRFAAQVQLAAMAVAADDLAKAEGLLRPWITKDSGFTGQRAALVLGGYYEGSERAGDAEAVYRELLATWPTSTLGDATRDRLEAMGLEVDAAPIEAAGATMTPEPAGGTDAPAGAGE